MNKLLFTTIMFISVSISIESQDSSPNYVESVPGTEINISMIYIPDGTDLEAEKAEKKIKAFYMSAHEVTWDLYELYLNRTTDINPEPEISDMKAIDVDGITGASVPYVDMSAGLGTDEGMPVGNVTQLAATRFCKWLSAVTGRFYRLPTLEEWQYAARAGTKSVYFFGNDPDQLKDYAWYSANSEGTYHRIGTKKPSPWGLYDMYGNVAEWTLHESVENKDKSKAIMGGAFIHTGENTTPTSTIKVERKWKERDPQFPKSKWWFTDAPFVGFRIVSPVEIPPASEFALYWRDK